ncbi:MAG: hypothetical protein HY036_05240 [Nitrospirae bacterium]|nr:hypothetical protein [Nitrospirota bacterium]
MAERTASGWLSVFSHLYQKQFMMSSTGSQSRRRKIQLTFFNMLETRKEQS